MKRTKKEKAIAFVDKIYKAAKKYRDTKGYKENLGYDQQPKLEDFINKLDMPYSEAAKVIEYFYVKIDSL